LISFFFFKKKIAIYPRASFFNHSCSSNCYTERKGPILFIVACEDIKQGI